MQPPNPGSKTSQAPSGKSGVARQTRQEHDQRTTLVRALGLRDLLPVSGAPAERAAMIASRQRGRVNRRQLLAAGLTTAVIQTMLANGQLHRLHRGVYTLGHRAPTDLGEETAALLAVKAEAWLSHTTAARVWGLGVASDGLELTVVGNVARARPRIHVHRTTHLHPSERRIHKGLPLTSPARTLLDLAPRLSTRQLERALDEAIVQRIARPSQLKDVLGRGNGHAGAAVLKALIADRTTTTITRSEAEERFLELIRAANLPVPQMNADLHGFSVDFFWRSHNLVVEVDGYQFHSTRSAFERDRRKDAVLKRAGIDVMRVTWSLIDREPYALIADIAQGLARGVTAP